MLHYIAGAAIQVANLVNYNCHPLKDGNKQPIVYAPTCSHSLTLHVHLRA